MAGIWSPHWRTFFAASGAAACLALAACSGGGHPSHSPGAQAEPASGPRAIAAVKSTWETFFNGTVAIPRRLKLLQNSQQFAAFVHAQEKTTIGALVLQASARVSSVQLQPPGQATVTFTVLLAGKPLAKNLHGTAVYVAGKWMIADSSFCTLLRLAYGKKSHQMPAACGS
jgi:hypothetical protein